MGQVYHALSGGTPPAQFQSDDTIVNENILSPVSADMCGTINKDGDLGESSCIAELPFVCKFIYHENGIVFISKDSCDQLQDAQFKTIKDYRSQSVIQANIDLMLVLDLY